MKKAIKIAVVTFLFLLVSKNGMSQELNYKSYSLFVYNFIKYMEWPDNNRNEFIIGVYGESGIVKELQALARTKRGQNKPLVIKQINSPDEALNCDLVYFPTPKSSLVKPVSEKVKHKPVLLVAEREGLAKKGAMISFVTTDEDILKFDINKKAIEEQNLKVATTLVMLGYPVK